MGMYGLTNSLYHPGEDGGEVMVGLLLTAQFADDWMNCDLQKDMWMIQQVYSVGNSPLCWFIETMILKCVWTDQDVILKLCVTVQIQRSQ